MTIFTTPCAINRGNWWEEKSTNLVYLTYDFFLAYLTHNFFSRFILVIYLFFEGPYGQRSVSELVVRNKMLDFFLNDDSIVLVMHLASVTNRYADGLEKTLVDRILPRVQ